MTAYVARLLCGHDHGRTAPYHGDVPSAGDHVECYVGDCQGRAQPVVDVVVSGPLTVEGRRW